MSNKDFVLLRERLLPQYYLYPNIGKFNLTKNINELDLTFFSKFCIYFLVSSLSANLCIKAPATSSSFCKIYACILLRSSREIFLSMSSLRAFKRLIK